jgi:hypothetical protein
MCDPITRRGFLGSSLGGFFGFALARKWDWVFAQEAAGKAKRCIVLWMNGGPSQIDTFDPKPGKETGGMFSAIDTAVPGVRIGEHLPEIARRMKSLSIVRSMTSTEGEHVRAQYMLHTGFEFVESFPRPSMGAVISHETPPRKFPRYVTIGASGFGPAALGSDHAPFTINRADEALRILRNLEKRRDRLKWMQELDHEFNEDHPSGLVEKRQSLVGKIEALLDTDFVRALDLSKEPEAVRKRYGTQQFGQGCLLARRLVEAGVNFVEVRQDGWDTHQNNFAGVERLCGQIDRPWGALMDDLSSKGLLDETLVIWMGEFGRTPQVNRNQGRDHYPRVFSAVIGGGGIAGGRVIGETNALGTEITKRPVPVPDLFATIYDRFGIPADKKFPNPFGARMMATEEGKVVRELIG